MTTFTPEVATSLSGPEWLRARRRDAVDRFAGLELPTEAEEIWRYSRISQLDLGAYTPTPAARPVAGGVPKAVEPGLASIAGRAGLVVVSDGRLVHAELDAEAGGRGVVLGELTDARDGDELLGSVA